MYFYSTLQSHKKKLITYFKTYYFNQFQDVLYPLRINLFVILRNDICLSARRTERFKGLFSQSTFHPSKFFSNDCTCFKNTRIQLCNSPMRLSETKFVYK